MERRFTVKDFWLFACICGIFVTLLLVMYMIDRQWLKMSQMQNAMSEQAGDLRELRSLVNNLEQRLQLGTLQTNTVNTPKTEQFPSAFKRAQAATQQAEYTQGGTLVRTFGSNPKTITPLVSGDAYAS
ncbi:MAG: ABC transporter substrate-binding protein, partial [Pseudomonadota bacterium]